MKSYTGLICIIGLSNVTSFAQSRQEQFKLQYFPVDSLVGKWVSYSTEFEETISIIKKSTVKKLSVSRCNICPEIDFRPDSTITIKPADSDDIHMTSYVWSAKGNNIIIRDMIEGNGMSNFLSAGQYTIGARTSGLLGLDKQVVLADKNGTRYVLIRDK